MYERPSASAQPTTDTRIYYILIKLALAAGTEEDVAISAARIAQNRRRLPAANARSVLEACELLWEAGIRDALRLAMRVNFSNTECAASYVPPPPGDRRNLRRREAESLVQNVRTARTLLG